MLSLSSLSKKLNFILLPLLGILFFSCYRVEKTRTLDFQSPIKNPKLTQKYNPHKKRPHLGIDLKAPQGTPVLSIEKGRVVYMGTQFTGYGKVILIEHDSHWTSLYAHLNSFSVRRGKKVKKAQKIGTVGNTGRSTGSHLHLELFYNKRNVNPLLAIPISKIIK